MFSSIVRKIREAAAVFGEAAEGKLGTTKAVQFQFKLMELADSLDAPSERRESVYIPATEEYEVYDFHKAEAGMLVTRSDHWLEMNKGLSGKKSMYGIITRFSFFGDSKCRLVTYPSVHWEGESSSSMNHPLLVEPLRERDKKSLPKIKMDDGQWGDKGPTG